MSIFYLIGILYDKVRQDLMLVVSVIGTSLAITAVPWCPNFYIMLAVRLVAGILAASLDTGLMIYMYFNFSYRSIHYSMFMFFGSVCLPVRPPVPLSCCLHTCLSVCLSVCLSACLPACPSVCQANSLIGQL